MDKKTSMQNAGGGMVEINSMPKHQHNTPPQYLRYMNNQRHSPMIHQHIHQAYQPSNKYNANSNASTPNIHANPLHLHVNNQYIYQQNQIKQISPPAYPPHNISSILQTSPQPWVPTQPPANYAIHQIQPKPSELPPSPASSNHTPVTSASTPMTPVHSVSKHREVERKKSGSQQLRSPSAKRPTNAPVTLQGWLHKQGSDGLMLWKKRWFVLSEYVLFYYKGAEEEKLLGSILLPSYNVSICGVDDKVNRKYAFKCEHTNMRTYILAADSHELMMHWIRELTLACILQTTNIDADSSVVTTPSTYNLNETMESNFSQHVQPLQKPTQLPLTQPLNRLPLHTHSSSNTTELSNPSNQELAAFNQPLYANAPPKPRRLNDTGYSSPSPPEMFNRYNEPKYVTLQPPPYNMQRTIVYGNHADYGYQDYAGSNCLTQNAERRTPDTYGRSKTHHPSDYEDIYGEHLMYKRPLSPLAYNKSFAVAMPIQRMHALPNGPESQRDTVPRPHSADFLEYEITHRQQSSLNARAQPMRPKSSLDINRTIGDNYFYSEERYAEKMRKSAQYLAKLPGRSSGNLRRTINQENTYTIPPTRSHNAQSNAQALNASGEYVYIRKDVPLTQPQRSRSVLSEGSISKELDLDLSPQYKVRMQDEDFYRYEMHDYDPFTRSASARLANIEKRLQGDGRATMNKEGERKREESMKRLLEWKQRMLQSPLNRKVNQNVNKSYKTDHYKRNNSYAGQPVTMGHNHYSSYSSDDEENADAMRTKESSTMQAGRTVDTANAQPCDASAPYTALPSLLASSNKQCKAYTTPLTLSSTSALQCTSPIATQCNVQSLSSTCPTTTNLTSKNGPGMGTLVKSILAEFAKRAESRPETPVLQKQQMADQGAILEENYMPMTPKKSVFVPPPPPNTIDEDNENEENPYVEMTQRLMTQSILDPNNAHQPYEVINFEQGIIEPVYMELNHAKLARVGDVQLKEHSLNEQKPKLPDILMPIQLPMKTDCSEMFQPVEVSPKDLEVIYASNPRFSLSDTFRPASYYLGASHDDHQCILPEQDSSDSEIVSPPPIPTSPLPLDDLGSEDVSQVSAFDDGEMKTMMKSKDVDRTSLNSIQTDDFDLSRLSQQSDSDLEVNIRTPSAHIMFKRRPMSEMYRDEIESVDSDFNKTELIKYLKKIDDDNANNATFDNNKYHDYENMIVTKFTATQASGESQNTSAFRSETSSSDTIKLMDKMIDFKDFPHFDPYIGHSAPYYYSDLGLNTNIMIGSGLLKLNNQRGTHNAGKRDIRHIINPIRCNNNMTSLGSDVTMNSIDQFQLANEARSVSMDFLNLTDKSGQIDKKNVYESDTLKRTKGVDQSNQTKSEMRNVYPQTNEKFEYADATNDNIVRRTHSLEGLLENVLNDDSLLQDTSTRSNPNTEGSYLWEEDEIWRERLRDASQRHTKSLDDLDVIGATNVNMNKKPSRAITRGVVYVNDNVYNMSMQSKYVKSKECHNEKACELGESATNVHIRKDVKSGQKENFMLDREKLRQWDLMSSAPSDAEEICGRRANREGNVAAPTTLGQAEDAASGSMFMKLHDTFSRNHSDMQPYPEDFGGTQSRSTSNLNHNGYDGEYEIWQDYYISRAPSQQNIDLENRKIQLMSDKQKLSAGDLLGRTHEELVLLLIQLRRQSTTLCHAIESGYNEIDKIQARLQLMDATKRLENLQKLEQIKQHLIDLEKQYEKGKPMVNLVDNMVKLGSLYRFPKNDMQATFTTRERNEFNQQVQERKLRAEEQRDWCRVNSNHDQLQEKVDQLYELDQMIHEGSGTLQGLQQNKEEIERALGGIRSRILHGYHDPEVVEKAKKQQSILEHELSRVHLMLAENSKKLEETVAGNARLEQELLVLKQKLQISKHARGSPPSSTAGDSLPCIVGANSALMESDLHKVQQKVGDLQKQRQELSMQVKQLTDRSSLQQNRLFSPSHQDGKKKIQSSQWRETDLDTMNIYDHSDQWTSNSSIPSSIPSVGSSIPSLYLKLEDRNAFLEDSSYYKGSENAIIDLIHSPQQEKPEIKTVRIVKRESERRHRDRDRDKPPTTSKYDALLEDDIYSTNSSPSRSATVQKSQIQNHFPNLTLNFGDNSLNRTTSTPSIAQIEKETESSPVLSPVFKSEAARQIITEISLETPRQANRRAVPIEKRRHYTAPHHNLIKSLNPLPTDEDSFDKMLETRRARDDLDMERALRHRNEPDVVRSTLSSKELKYNENTIDSILGTPNKIFIPERYIPEQLPQLSAEEEQHRLRKVESIKKMLSESTILSTSSANLAGEENEEAAGTSSSTTKSSAKIEEEKKQREHLLQMNQILAKQVMEMSKIVAVKALQTRREEQDLQSDEDDDDLSPESILPLYQQRDNFYS